MKMLIQACLLFTEINNVLILRCISMRWQTRFPCTMSLLTNDTVQGETCCRLTAVHRKISTSLISVPGMLELDFGFQISIVIHFEAFEI